MTKKKPEENPVVLRKDAAMSFTGLAPTQFGVLVASGKFPQPIPMGGRAVVWARDEVLAWFEERKAKRAEEMAARKAARAAREQAPKKKARAQ